VSDHIEAITKEAPSSSKHARNRVHLKCLRTFRDDLVSINTYGYRDPVDITITRYDMEIASLKKQLADKDEELATQNKKLEKLKIYESKYKVKITNGYLSAFLDLIHQFREIRTTNEN